MIKLVVLLKRRADLTPEEFRNYYETKHAVLGREMLSAACHYERRFLKAVTGGMGGYAGLGETYDCITEAWFPDEAAMQETFAKVADPKNFALIEEDEAKLFERDKIRFYIVEEECLST